VNSVGDSVVNSVGDSVVNSVGDSVVNSVWSSVGESVRASVQQIWDENWRSYYFGQFDAGTLGFFEYFREVCNLQKETEKAIPLWDLSKHSSWLYLYKNIAVISDKPIKIAVNKAGKIHCDDGPCVLYSDGFAVYGLNGIRLTKEIVETPAKDLSAKLILTEKNAEIRREIVRKIGIERICADLNSVIIDKRDNYELLKLDLGDGTARPYLKMKNPSIDAVHIEGVHPDCDTVDKALAWRNGLDKFEEPNVLT
jgi:hypothetical protein